MFLCGMRKRSRHWPDGGDKYMVWKGTPSHMPCQWPLLLAAPLHPHVCVRALWGWVHPTASLRLPGGPTRHHHQQSLPWLSSPHSPAPPSPVLSPHLLYQQDINVTNATALPSPSQISFQQWDPVGLSISDFPCVQCLYLGLPHTRAHWCAAQKCT